MCSDEKENRDKDLWQRLSETVSPLNPDQLRKSLKTDAPKEQAPGKSQHKKTTISPKPKPKTSTSHAQNKPYDPDSSADIDRRTLARLKKGQIPIEATLDLHGLTQKEAYLALQRFISQSHTTNKRCVLVITGKGTRDFEGHGEFKRGVIRQNFSGWVKEPFFADYILKYVPAQIRDGGDGAFYVYLKRSK